jgi:hypothetical protein
MGTFMRRFIPPRSHAIPQSHTKPGKWLSFSA